MENLDSIMRRVKKLLAIAEDSRGDPNECAAAARMAESIMRKYQIDHADAISVELQTEAAFDTGDVGSTLDPERRSVEAAGWAGRLAVAVAKLYDAQARYVRTVRYGKTLRFSGYKVDVEMARYTYLFIVNSMAAASRAYLKDTYGAGRAAGEAFRQGYIAAVCSKLAALRREKDAEMQQASSSRALVLNKANAVAAHFGSVKYGKGGGYRTSQGDAFQSGREQGSRLDVGRRGVTGGSPVGRISA
jgi:hypothetical protein